jgi:hypothetical protein
MHRLPVGVVRHVGTGNKDKSEYCNQQLSHRTTDKPASCQKVKRIV